MKKKPLVAYGDVLPSHDDSFYLGGSDGSTTKGFKGVKFPHLKLYELDEDTLSLENLAGGTLKNLKIGGFTLDDDTKIQTGVRAPSYVVYKQDSTYYAVNGATGVIDYSGADAGVVVKSCTDAGATWIFLKSGVAFTLWDTGGVYKIPDNVTIQGEAPDTNIISTPTPASDNAALGLNSQVINVKIQDAFDGDPLAPAGTARYVKFACNMRSTNNINFSNWSRQYMLIAVGEDGVDEPGIGISNYGIGDGLYIGNVDNGAGLNLENSIGVPAKTGIGVSIANYGAGSGIQSAGKAGSTGPVAKFTTDINLAILVDVPADYMTEGACMSVHSAGLTSGTMFNGYQATSAFAGQGVYFNFGCGAGSFTGLFALFQVNNVTKFSVDYAGAVTIANAKLSNVQHSSTDESLVLESLNSDRKFSVLKIYPYTGNVGVDKSELSLNCESVSESAGGNWSRLFFEITSTESVIAYEKTGSGTLKPLTIYCAGRETDGVFEALMTFGADLSIDIHSRPISNMLLANDESIKWKDSGGTSRLGITLNSSDQFDIRNEAGGPVNIQYGQVGNVYFFGGPEGSNEGIYLRGEAPPSGAGNTQGAAALVLEAFYRNDSDVITSRDAILLHKWTSVVGGLNPKSYLNLSVAGVDVAQFSNNDGTVSITSLGDIDIGANCINTTSLCFKQSSSTSFSVRNLADTAYLDVTLRHLWMGTSASQINGRNVDASYFMINARKTGDFIREVARVQGAADPWFGLGVDGNALRGTNAGLLGFFGATPVSQRLKADYNNWASLGDVVDALVALGLFDQS